MSPKTVTLSDGSVWELMPFGKWRNVDVGDFSQPWLVDARAPTEDPFVFGVPLTAADHRAIADVLDGIMKEGE